MSDCLRQILGVLSGNCEPRPERLAPAGSQAQTAFRSAAASASGVGSAAATASPAGK
jgi:hypothetical protein